MVIAIVIVACVANYWLIIPSVIVTILLLLFRTYFLCTARDLQRLEAIGKLPSQNKFIVQSLQLVVHCIHTYQLQFRD